MSLASLYRRLHDYEDKVAYWQNSANTYSQWIVETEQKIAYKEDQLAKATASLAACNELTGKNQDVESDLTALGTALATSLDDGAASVAVGKLDDNNAGYVQGSIAECEALIGRINEELAQLRSQLATYQEGLAYSNGRVSHYEGCVADTWDRINSYDDDDD